MKKSMATQLAEVKSILEIERGNMRSLDRELRVYKERVTMIAAENESLRKDKSWLQSMLSNMMQSIALRKV